MNQARRILSVAEAIVYDGAMLPAKSYSIVEGHKEIAAMIRLKNAADCWKERPQHRQVFMLEAVGTGEGQKLVRTRQLEPQFLFEVLGQTKNVSTQPARELFKG
jgi:hypothetical protein